MALEINWPKEYEWEVVDKLDKDSIYVRKIIPKGENEKNPSIICQALAVKPPDIYKADFTIKKLNSHSILYYFESIVKYFIATLCQFTLPSL